MRPEKLPEPAVTIDTSGRLCPYPIVEAARTVKTMDAGAVLLVIATDPGISLDMPMWCRATKNEHLATFEEEKGRWCSYVRVGARPARSP
jgi:tRNA 2-thiouridine synthesizing protein A